MEEIRHSIEEDKPSDPGVFERSDFCETLRSGETLAVWPCADLTVVDILHDGMRYLAYICHTLDSTSAILALQVVEDRGVYLFLE